jgi:hypothetical protein
LRRSGTADIQRVWHFNRQVYGTKVGLQLNGETFFTAPDGVIDDTTIRCIARKPTIDG